MPPQVTDVAMSIHRPIVNVFVSSTQHDLEAERQALERMTQRLELTKFVGPEYLGSRDENTTDGSLDEVDRSDVFVIVLAGRYGSGITEKEYRRARARGLPCFTYLKWDRSIPTDARESDPERARALDGLKQELRNSRISTTFTTPDDLAAKVTADLHRWISPSTCQPSTTGTGRHARAGHWRRPHWHPHTRRVFRIS